MMNKVEKTLIKVLKDKKILFLENDSVLDDSVGNLSKWILKTKIPNSGLLAFYELEKSSYEYILRAIDEHDIIIFETTWATDISKKLKQYILSKKEDKKIIIECYVNEPSFVRKPQMIHDLYVLDSYDLDVDSWKLNKLRVNKAYWEN